MNHRDYNYGPVYYTDQKVHALNSERSLLEEESLSCQLYHQHNLESGRFQQ